MARINPNYDKIKLFTKNINKGYVFKLKYRLSNDAILNLQKQLVEQLKNGIIIYPDETLELVDIYNIEIKKLSSTKEEEII